MKNLLMVLLLLVSTAAIAAPTEEECAAKKEVAIAQVKANMAHYGGDFALNMAIAGGDAIVAEKVTMEQEYLPLALWKLECALGPTTHR